MRTWKPFDDEPEGLPSHMRVDGLDEADHRARLTRSPQVTIVSSFPANHTTNGAALSGVSFALQDIASAFGEGPWGIGTGGCS
jgi:hypothetical protein